MLRTVTNLTKVKFNNQSTSLVEFAKVSEVVHDKIRKESLPPKYVI